MSVVIISSQRVRRRNNYPPMLKMLKSDCVRSCIQPFLLCFHTSNNKTVLCYCGDMKQFNFVDLLKFEWNRPPCE